MRFALILVLITSGCGGDSDSSGSSTSDTKTVTIAGALSVGELTEEEEAQTGLTSGDPIDDGVIFAMMFADQTATSDDEGSFSLEIDLGADAEDETPELEIMTWVTKVDDDGETHRLGLRSTADGDVNDPLSLGSLNLIYTMGLHIDVQNELEEPVEGCEISVEDMESQAQSEEVGKAGRYDLDYLPAGEYTLLVSCDGFEATSFTYDVPAADKFDDWVTPDPVEVTAAQ